MPRASRNSQAAMASAVVPDESLRTFYTYNPNVSTSSSSDALSTHTNNDDPMWTRRTGGGSSATTGMTTRRVSGRGSTSNMTDVSVSSASLNSPMQSSHAASEASSYATRGVPGVIDELDERNAEQNRDHEDDHDSDESEGIVVVARSSTLNANRRRRVPRGSDEGTPERDNRMADGSELNHNQNDTSEGISTSHFSSRLLDESEDDDLTNGTNGGGGYNSHLNGDNDSLADALPEEVEARAREVIGWETVGQDTELYVVDLERWKNINDKYSTPGTAEYREFVKLVLALCYFFPLAFMRSSSPCVIY